MLNASPRSSRGLQRNPSWPLRHQQVITASLAAALAVALLAGCAGPSAHYGPGQPLTTVPAQWTESQPAEAAAPAVRWWQALGSAELDRMIETALARNADVRMALAAVAEAEAHAELQAAERRPLLTLNAEGGRSRSPESDNKTVSRGQWTGRAAWEIDLFDRKALLANAARLDAAGAAEAAHAAATLVAAEIAQTWLEIEHLNERRRLLAATADNYRRLASATEQKLQAGLATRPDVERTQAELAVTESDQAAVAAQLRAKRYRLATLSGGMPMPAAESATAPLPTPPDLLPSALLDRRPDVRQARLALDAALARLASAERARFPSLTLTLDLGRQALRQPELPTLYGPLYALGAGLTAPLFDAGRIRANINLTDAQVRKTAADYDRVVLRALEDVETAWTQWHGQRSQRESQDRAWQSATRAAADTRKLFEAGLADITAVLDTQRARLRIEEAQAQARTAERLAWVALQRAYAGHLPLPGLTAAATLARREPH